MDLLATQWRRQESHATLVEAMLTTNRLPLGFHVNSKQELRARLIQIDWQGDLWSATTLINNKVRNEALKQLQSKTNAQTESCL